MHDFALCLECMELHYAPSNNNSTYIKKDVSSNHTGHRIHVFKAPETYSPPICNILTKLHAGLPISNNEIVLFKLCIQLEGLEENE